MSHEGCLTFVVGCPSASERSSPHVSSATQETTEWLGRLSGRLEELEVKQGPSRNWFEPWTTLWQPATESYLVPRFCAPFLSLYPTSCSTWCANRQTHRENNENVPWLQLHWFTRPRWGSKKYEQLVKYLSVSKSNNTLTVPAMLQQ